MDIYRNTFTSLDSLGTEQLMLIRRAFVLNIKKSASFEDIPEGVAYALMFSRLTCKIDVELNNRGVEQ